MSDMTPPDGAAGSPEPAVQPRRGKRLATQLGNGFLLLEIGLLTLLAGWMIRYRVKTSTSWLAHDDLGLTWVPEAVIVLSLVISGSALLASWRAGIRGHTARTWLLVGSLFLFLAVGSRTYQLVSLHASGTLMSFVQGRIHDQTDVYYVQAVSQRLRECHHELELQAVSPPPGADGLDREAEQGRLQFVETLQQRMATWTETEIGQWLNRDAEQQGLITLLAYQIYPRASERHHAAAVAEAELERLPRRRACFELIEQYCSRKVELFERQRTIKDAAGADGRSASIPAEFAALETDFQNQLAAANVCEQERTAPIIALTRDAITAAECALGIKSHLAAIDARLVFLQEEVIPLFDQPHPAGWNQQYNWLRLPICVPSGKTWLAGFLLVAGLHLLTMLLALLLLVGMLIKLGTTDLGQTLRFVIRCWLVSLLISSGLVAIFFTA